jgi:hypothetical protein
MAAKQIGLFGATGILLAVIIIASLAVGGDYLPNIRLPSRASNTDTNTGTNTGKLTILIMDAPVELEHLNVTIDWVKIKGHNGTWMDLEIKGDAPFYVDLLALRNVTETLSETTIPAGNYSRIDMHVLTANATYVGGDTDKLKVPSNVIKVLLKPHLNLEPDGSITVLIDLQPNDLKSIAISRSLNLRPVIRARVE